MDKGWEVLFCMPAGGWDFLYDRLEQGLPPWTTLKRATAAQPLAAQVASADVLVPTTAVCGADVVNAARNLKLIVQPAAGYNNIAVEAAQARGIPVCTSPGINAASVAEAAIMMLLMLARRVPEQLVTFAKRGLGEPLGMQLSGKTLGIIGMGAIGMRVARAAEALGMHVRGHRSASTPAELSALLTAADALGRGFTGLACAGGQHCPLTPATVGLLGARELRAMKPGALVINYGRGELIDKQALLEALRDGHLGGVGLDVFWEEPADPADELFSFPNVIALPHTGVSTHDVVQTYVDLLSDNITRCREGRTLQHRLP